MVSSDRAPQRLVAYLRISTDTQKENTSLEVQYEKIEQYCQFSGQTMAFCAWDIETASGARRRRGLETALDMIYRNEADGLICLKLDRFARNTIEGLKIATELKKLGKQLVILNLNLDSNTPIGECIFTILLAFAQLEHATIKERITSGKDKIRDHGGYVEGRPPYGYMAVKCVTTGKKLVARHPEQYPWLEQIKRWHDSAWSYQDIAKELNRIGVPTQSGRRWYSASVNSMLNRRSQLADWAEELHERDSDCSEIEVAREWQQCEDSAS